MEIKQAIDRMRYRIDTASDIAGKGVDGKAYEDMEMAIAALEKQIPQKPVMKPFYEDMEEEYLCCPTCGDILTDRMPMDNKEFYFHCLNCGQKFKWED